MSPGLLLDAMLALAWVRLGATDVALAEAGLGAGFTGALLLDAAFRLDARPERPGARGPVAALLCAAVGGVLLWALVSLPAPPGPLPQLVRERLPDTGVKNPVTAVLLDFRGYDTLLEVGVLWLAALAAWAVLPARPAAPADAPVDAGPVLTAAARLGVPVAVLVALYLLWAGSSLPGGAFQAAALLAGAAVVLLVSGRLSPVAADGAPLRLGLVAGTAVFLAVAVAMVGAGGGLLDYPRGAAYGLMLLIEVVAMVSIALVLAVLFAGRRHVPGARRDEEVR